MEMARTPGYRTRIETLNENLDGQPRHESRENATPDALPSTLNGMLKTATETGELDLFTINSLQLPRLPSPSKRFQSSCLVGLDDDDDSPPRSQQESRYPNGLSCVDDRRCLPSYTRDVTSEIVSMYETASQKAFYIDRYEESNPRTYSMNQSSQSTNTLSNHRSFASLRSQPEPFLPQQPRSPFPYPSRLKRHGFRPSSPALTDVGGVDYARRVEIDRLPTSSVYNASPPTSFYAHKKFLAPLSTRSDTNKSNQSFLNTSPPQRLRLSEQTRSNDCLLDWRNRPEFVPVNALSSPARSNCSFASTEIILQAGPQRSMITTSAKPTPSSPLYYDYTEDFEDEPGTQDYGFVERLPLPPLISMVDRIIHEDEEQSSEWSSPDTSIALSPRMTSHTQARARLPDEEGHLVEATLNVNGEESPPDEGVHDILSLYATRQVLPDRVVPERLPRNTAQQINSHPDCSEDTFTRCDDHSTTIRTVEQSEIRLYEEDDVKNFQKATRVGRCGRDETGGAKTICNRSSMYNSSTHLPNFPEPVDLMVRFSSDPATTPRSQRVIIRKPRGNDSGSVQETGPRESQMSSQGESEQQCNAQLMLSSSVYPHELCHATVPCRSSTRVNNYRSSRFFSVDYGLQDFAQLITRFEDANQRVSKDVGMQPADFLMRPLPALPLYMNTPIPRDFPNFLDDLKPRPLLNKFRSESDIRRTIEDLRKAALIQPRTLQPPFATVSDPRPHHEHNEITLCGSSILSPDLIAPNKLPRAKNSIIGLMKALPPLPPNSTRAATPVKQILEEIVSPPSTRNDELRFQVEDISFGDSVAGWPSVEFNSTFTKKIPPPPLPKFKLKSSTSGVRLSSSPEQSHPWNSDESYPWTGKQSLLLSSTLGKSDLTNPHMFKLKGENPPDMSCTGTIRVNRHVKSRLSMNNMELINPKDLFTTTSNNLNNVPQQCDPRIQRASSSDLSDEQFHTDSVSVSLGLEALSQQRGVQRQKLREKFYDPQGIIPTAETKREPFNQPAATLISPLDVQSFFSDDSSQFRSHNSLRNRLSNFRVRKDRNLGEHALQTPRTRRSEIQSNIAVAEQHKTFLPDVRHKLKSKASQWFKHAESAVLKYLHARKQGNLGVSSSHDV